MRVGVTGLSNSIPSTLNPADGSMESAATRIKMADVEALFCLSFAVAFRGERLVTPVRVLLQRSRGKSDESNIPCGFAEVTTRLAFAARGDLSACI